MKTMKTMKNKKSIYLAALAALALTACSNDNESIFDQSAADRLEQYKKDYADILTDNGGLWTMEYFSNDEEPGYLFVMKFDPNGSVKIASNHKWIDDQYKEETSLWKMVADNGPVLSFNSYNSVFHIFADPANITGPNAPINDATNKDIDETGYGHEGDYEFQVMEVSDDHNTVRLLGKKRMLNIYLRRLDPATDMQAYMDSYKEVSSNLFSESIPAIYFNDADGERYVVKDAHTGLMSIYPENGDAVEQTRTSSFIITPSGIRFIKPLNIVNAAGQEKTITEFKFVRNLSLALIDNESSIISAGSLVDVLYSNMKNWTIDMTSFTGPVKEKIDAFVSQLATLYKYKSAKINDMSFDYDRSIDSYVMRLYLKTGNKSSETDRYIVKFNESDGGVKIEMFEPADVNSGLALNAYTALQDFFTFLGGATIQYSSPSDCGPAYYKFNIDGGEMTIRVQ